MDCIYAAWIPPIAQIGFGVGIPAGPPVRFTVQTDTFRPVTAAAVVNGGTGYVVGISSPPGTQQGQSPIGAPAQLRVETLSGSAVATVSVVKPSAWFSLAKRRQLFRSADQSPGTRFDRWQWLWRNLQPDLCAASPQRVILTDQPNASLVYCRDVTDINVMDDAFQEALSKVLGATICIPLSGDKTSPSLHLKKPIVRSPRLVAMMATKA